MDTDAICNTSILKSALWLSVYNSTPLVCKNPLFAHEFAAAMLSTKLHFSLVSTPVNSCLVILNLDFEKSRELYGGILKHGMPRATQSLRSPLLLHKANQVMMDTENDNAGCPLEKALVQVTQQLVTYTEETKGARIHQLFSDSRTWVFLQKKT
jgi:hypothetical protein